MPRMKRVVAAPGTASADEDAVATCLGHNTLDSSFVKPNPESPTAWGYINLCEDNDFYFAQYIHVDANLQPAPMPAGFYGQAQIFIYTNGVYQGPPRSCSTGGTGVVTAGRVSCTTSRYPSTLTSITFVGGGYVYRDTGSAWVLAAQGLTLRCNKHTAACRDVP